MADPEVLQVPPAEPQVLEIKKRLVLEEVDQEFEDMKVLLSEDFTKARQATEAIVTSQDLMYPVVMAEALRRLYLDR